MNRHEKPSGRTAQLNVKGVEARRLAEELTELTGESLTEAVTAALRDRLVKERRERRKPAEVARRLLEFGEWYAQFPDKDTRTADEILGYDENGLPR